MNMQYVNVLGTVAVGSVAGVNDTISTVVIPPWRGAPPNAPMIQQITPTVNVGEGVTHLTRVNVTNGATAGTLTLMKPKNRTYITTAIAANGTALKPAVDPGLYSTSYGYPQAGGFTTGTAVVADNAIATNDLVVLQLKDGTFHVSMIASGTYAGNNLVLTTAVPNVTGGGAAVGAALYFYGIPTDKDPADGKADISIAVAAVATSGVGFNCWDNPTFGFTQAMHQGDPLLFYSPNVTNFLTLNYISGFYAKV